MKRLVVDDIRVFNFEADYCRTTGEFRNLYQWFFPPRKAFGQHYDECWLDNDMGFKRGTFELEEEVRILVNEIEEMAAGGVKLPIDTFVIHTNNDYAANQMEQALQKWYNVERVDARKYMK